MQESAHLTSMTAIAADIDPAVEKVIRRCLDPDPAKRPGHRARRHGRASRRRSAGRRARRRRNAVARNGAGRGHGRRHGAQVFGALPGAGRARPAGRHPDARRRAPRWCTRSSINRPTCWRTRRREIAASFGYPAKPADSAVWLEHRGELWLTFSGLPAPRQVGRVAGVGGADPRRLSRKSACPEGRPVRATWRTTILRRTCRAWSRAVLDGNGRLRDFSGHPASTDAALSPARFRRDGLPRRCAGSRRLHRDSAPRCFPPRRSTGARPGKDRIRIIPNTELTLDVAWWKGRVVQCACSVSLHAARRAAAARNVIRRQVGNGGFQIPALWLGCILRAAACACATGDSIARIIRAPGASRPPVSCCRPSPGREASTRRASTDLLDLGLHRDRAKGCFWRAVLWLVYLALEPAVRARWPHSIMTWNRVLAGRWLDAQVGFAHPDRRGGGCRPLGVFQDGVLPQGRRAFELGCVVDAAHGHPPVDRLPGLEPRWTL